METPKTLQGFLTEQIMAAAVRKLGRFPTHNYNALFTAVLETLNQHLENEHGAQIASMSRKEFFKWLEPEHG